MNSYHLSLERRSINNESTILECARQNDGSAPDPFQHIGHVRRALKQGGVSDEEIDAYTREATSRFYNHLIYTTITWVETY